MDNRYSVRRDRYPLFWVRRRHSTSATRYDVRAHPFERLIHVRRRNRGPFLRFAIELADGGDEPRGSVAFAPRCAGRGHPSEGARRLASSPPRDFPSSTRVAGPFGRGAGDSSPPRTNRPRSASDAAPRRATLSDEPRCFPPIRNHHAFEASPGEVGLRASWDRPLSRRPSLS